MKSILLLASLLLLSPVLNAQKVCGTQPRTVYPAPNPVISRILLPIETVIRIPVAFHVLYKNSTENIPDAKLKELLPECTLDFNGQNPSIGTLPDEFKQYLGIVKFEFYLADKNEAGEHFSGIIRKTTSTQVFHYRRREAFYESRILNSKKFLNVYVCDVNRGTAAFTPTEVNERTDGIVIDYLVAKKGEHTLTHEIGHWLDLYHIFSKTCSGSDGVNDTRTQFKHFGCPKHPLTECGQHVMFMNFMDYTDCRIFFTAGQAERMVNYIAKYKQF